MSVFTVAILSFLVSLSIGKVLIPFFKKREFKNRAPEIARLGWLSALSFLRVSTLTAAWTFLLVSIIFKLTNLVANFSGNSAMVDSLLSGVNGLSQWFDGIRGNRFVTVLIILNVILIILFYRQGKIKAKELYEQLILKNNSSQLSPLPPDGRMDKIEKRIHKVNAEMEQVRATPDAELSTADLASKRKWLEALNYSQTKLQESYALADIDRRILEELEEEQPRPVRNNWWDKILTIISSEGMVKMINRSNKMLSRTGIVLLLLSFLGAAGQSIVTSADATAQQLVDVHIQLERNDIDEWEQSMVTSASTAAPVTWTEEDDEMVDALARDFELEFAHSLIHSAGTVSSANALADYRIRSHAVRSNILASYQSHANNNAPYARTASGGTTKPKAKFSFYESAADFHGENTGRRSLMERFTESIELNSIAESRPQTSIGKRYGKYLRGRAKQYPSDIWIGIKAKYQAEIASFSRAASPKEVFGMVIFETIDGLAHEAFRGNADELSRAIQQRLSKQMTTSTVKKWVELNMEQYTRDLVSQPDMASTHQSYAERSGTPKRFVQYEVANSGLVPDAQTMSRHLADNPPFLDRIDRHPDELKTMDQSLRNMAIRQGRSVSELANNANSFKSLFPGSLGAEVNTVSGSMENNLPFEPDFIRNDPSPGDGNSPSTDKPQKPMAKPKRRRPSPSTGSLPIASRARSFGTLRGSSNIGGVLIGQEATNFGNTNVNMVAIDWEILDDKIKITLTDTKGLRHDAGTYDKDIAYQALAYAADGRPVTATMIKMSLEELPSLKILVHPALVDTELGCEAIAVDRFVDRYASRHPQVAEALQNAALLQLLYQYSALKVMASSHLLTTASKRSAINEAANQWEESLEKYYRDIYQYYATNERISKPEYCFIEAQPALYHAALWRTIKSALLASNGRISSFRSQLEKSSLSVVDLNEFMKADVVTWSGVRETAYSVDKELLFLRDNELALTPLRFMEQIAYVPFEEEAPNYDPWEFPALETSGIVEREVREGISRDGGVSRKVLKRMRSFTFAQRLFRAALNGDLGIDFPVKYLGKLAEILKDDVPWKATPRFNGYIRPEDLDQVIEIRTNNDRDATNLRGFIRSCGIMDEQNLRPCG